MTVALVLTAVLAGVAGSWSPCGLSMIETLGRRPLATVTFAAGALAGGALTFGGLAAIGAALGGPLPALACAVLIAAALGDAAGRRIVPQVRRQVPESWRRFLPLPLATGLYGVLLGLGFTTFLLSYATWALALACLAVGTPATGVAVGLAFGAGRALPVALLPDATLLGDRPQWLRGLRGAAAVALAAAAALLLAGPPAARAAKRAVADAYDPSAAGSLFAFQPHTGNGHLNRPADGVVLPGTHPAVDATEVAWVQDGEIVVADAATLTTKLVVPAPGADAIAISNTNVAWRSGDKILAADRTAPTIAVPIVTAQRDGSVGRPTLYGTRLAFDDQSRTVSRLLEINLASGVLHSVRRAHQAQLLAPTRTDRGLLYVRATYKRQQLILGGRVVYSTTPTARRDNGYEDGHHAHHQGYEGGIRPPTYARPRPGVTVTLWTTAMSGRSAYATRIRHLKGGRTRTSILRVDIGSG